ncbi:MAG: DUF2927 domain-containing protein [Pseudomonadota bacterium]
MHRVSAAAFAGTLSVLSACSTTQEPVTTAPANRAILQPTGPAVTTESAALRTHYARVQRALLDQELLRTDGGGPDTPYTAAMLARNFKKIALYEEFAGGNMNAGEAVSTLHRWEDPVRISLEFGGAITPEARRADRRAVDTYIARLRRATGHPIISVGPSAANFHVFVVDEPARRAIGPRLRNIIPTITSGTIDAVVNLRRSSYCLVFAWDPEKDGSYTKAVAVIRAEHPDLLRLSCIHEEIAQGLGLANDSPHARPSVFNDDEEFGLLTRHDEDLLGILYDRRLRPGMAPEEAMPIVRQIVQERMAKAR